MEIKKLKQKSKNLEPVLRIGKNSVNKNVLDEIEKLLKKRKLIKIKILNNCSTSKNEIINEVIESSNAVLVSEIGNTFAIYREKKPA